MRSPCPRAWQCRSKTFRAPLGFGLPGETVDGNDPRLVYDVMKRAIDRAARRRRTVAHRVQDCAWERHSAISAGKYDNDDAMLAWKRADPIPPLAKVLQEAGVSESQLQARQESREEDQRRSDAVRDR